METFSSREAKRLRRSRRNMILIGGFLVFLMVFSGLAMWEPADESEEFEYNGYLFVNNEGVWVTDVGGQRVSFGYSPRDVENVSAEDFSFASRRVYLLYEPDSESAGSFEMQRVAGFLGFKGFSVNEACLVEEGCGDLPVFNCTDTGGRDAVYFKSGGKNEVYNDGGCVVLEYSSDRELGLIAEVFIYKLLGVL